MSMFHGKNGKVVWNAEDGASDVDIQHVLSWNFDAVSEVAETTAMTDTWKTFVGGFKSWTATVECNADDAGPDVSLSTNETTTSNQEQGLGATWDDTNASPQTKVFLELWFTTAATNGIIYGPAICTGISHSQDKDDIAKATYTFQGNGQCLFVNDAEPDDFAEPLTV